MKTLNRSILGLALAASLVAPAALMPATAQAFGPPKAKKSLAQESKNRQKQKNTWRNIGLASAAAGVFGFVKGNRTLGIAGALGALYSADRYERDRKSQSRTDRERAALYSRPSFTRNGQRYVRATRTKNGKRYFYFKKA